MELIIGAILGVFVGLYIGNDKARKWKIGRAHV